MTDEVKQSSTEDKIRDFAARVEKLRQMGGAKTVAKQRDGGKLTARERLDVLFDPGTFQEAQLFVKHHATLFGMEKKE
ncbi:MAG: methylmalonyl-CoA carboxyltransferase, partial [Deltaproteobacteria bacterium]|nr:methylmalonyl-CoA carboxyltransferase [Deltaproteobacteria bacterium]